MYATKLESVGVSSQLTSFFHSFTLFPTLQHEKYADIDILS